MSNRFLKYVEGDDSQAGPFDRNYATPIDEAEQNVIGQSRAALDTPPESFGLVEFSTDAVKGFANAIASTPQIAGGTLAETGELAEGMEGQSTAEVAKGSFVKRFIDHVQTTQETPGLIDTAKIFLGVEKDALLSLFSGGEAPKVIANAGYAMIDQNKAALESMGLVPKQDARIAFDVGNTFGQVLATVGSTYITKSPVMAAAYMGALINSQDYLEARKAGKDPEEAAQIAAASAYGQGLIEMAGGKVFLAAAAGSTFMRRVLIRSTGQSAEEGAQGVVEESVKGASGVRNTTMEEKLANIGYQAMLGFVAGAPISAVVTKIEDAGRAQGFSDEQIADIADNLVANKDKIIDAATVLIDKETSGLATSPKVQAAAAEATKAIMAEEVAVAEAEATGTTEDPKIAAKVMLKSPNISGDTKSAIRGLGDQFSMEQLQRVSSKEDVPLAEALALEEKQTATLQENLNRWRQMTSSVRENTALTKRQVKETQELMIDFIHKSGLEAGDKAKFLTTLKNTQTAKQLVQHIDEIETRISSMLDAQTRRKIIGKLKDTVAKVKDSNTIAVDFAKQIDHLVNEIDIKKRQPATIASLQKTINYMQKNPDAAMPQRVLKKLEILNKKPLEEVTTPELQAIADEVDALVKQGKTKLALMESKKERLKQERLGELQKDSVPLNDEETKNAPIGERLSVMERIKNKYIDFKNRSKRIGIATNPMDVFFDMLDGGKSYKGANHRIFKQTVDKSFSRYLDVKEGATREVKALTDKLELDAQSFEKIGAWAVLQQDGGEKKLLESGITQQEIAGLQLNDKEMQMYKLMRRKLDGMLPAIQDVMRTVYNKNVDGVKDYFPFMTDHEAMQDFEIQDQLGDKVPQIGKKKNVEKGFTESRTLGKQKIRIDALGVFLKHVDNAAYLIEMGGDIKALGDVAVDSEYGEAVGDIGQEMVVEWVNLLARKGSLPGRIPALDALRRNVGFAVLGFKLSSIFVQPTALADGAALVGGGHVGAGVLKVADPAWRKFLWDNFPEIRERTGDDPAYLDMGGNTIIGDVRQAGFWALKQVDALAASAVAIGAYTRSVEQSGGEVDLNNPDPEAIREAQLMMRRTQSSSFAKDTPALLTQGELTGNVSVDRLIFQFQSFMLNRWSLIKHDLWELGIKNGDTKQALNVATWLMLATAAEIGIRRLSKELIGALTGDDPKPWEDTIGKEAVMTGLGTVPFVSQAVSSFEYGSLPVPSLGLLTQVGDRLKWAAQSKDPAKKAQHYTEAAILLTGASLGLPGTLQAEQITRGALKKKKTKKPAYKTP